MRFNFRVAEFDRMGSPLLKLEKCSSGRRLSFVFTVAALGLVSGTAIYAGSEMLRVKLLVLKDPGFKGNQALVRAAATNSWSRFGLMTPGITRSSITKAGVP